MAGIEDAKNGKLLYHLTKIDNFRSIVQKGLLPRYTIDEMNLEFSNVADLAIIDKRSEFGLDKYIPFHFHPYSAFDVAVKNTYNAQRMIYICLYRDYARSNGFKILPMHPLHMDTCVLYDYDEGFTKIDWDVLSRKNDASEYAREVKMAECLVDRPVYISDFASIFVPNEIIKQEINNIMIEEDVPLSFRPKIFIQSIWFSEYD